MSAVTYYSTLIGYDSNTDKLSQWTEVMPLRIFYHYKLAQAVPLEGSASYAEIAERSSLREGHVRRYVRAAMSNHIFDENVFTSRVRHTAISRLLATNPGFVDFVGLHVEEMGSAGACVIDAWNKWNQDDSEPNRTAYSLLNQTDLPIFELLAQHHERARRFDNAMRFGTADDSWDLRHILNAYDWTTLDHNGSLVVDVGGGRGAVS